MIYAMCIPYSKTGGTELMHQFVAKLRANGKTAYIVYPKAKDGKYLNEAFREYVDDYLLVDDIEDEKENIVVIPETLVNYSRHFKNATVHIWWLSVDNYFISQLHYPTMKKYFGTWIALRDVALKAFNALFLGEKYTSMKELKRIPMHLVQSEYAADFLKSYGISRVRYLTDYINKEFITRSSEVDFSKKEDIVLYNPKKGYAFTQKIIIANPNYKFVPLVNLTTAQVADLLMKAKLYIDFGHHPGKDRFPREAATMGCCLITGLNGAAAFNDIDIPTKFKIAAEDKNIPLISEQIAYCFNHYEEVWKQLEAYRKKIREEEAVFEQEVKNIYGVEYK